MVIVEDKHNSSTTPVDFESETVTSFSLFVSRPDGGDVSSCIDGCVLRSERLIIQMGDLSYSDSEGRLHEVAELRLAAEPLELVVGDEWPRLRFSVRGLLDGRSFKRALMQWHHSPVQCQRRNLLRPVELSGATTTPCDGAPSASQEAAPKTREIERGQRMNYVPAYNYALAGQGKRVNLSTTLTIHNVSREREITSVGNSGTGWLYFTSRGVEVIAEKDPGPPPAPLDI